MTVAELLARTTSRELAEWLAWYEMRAGESVMEALKASAAAKLGRHRRR